MHGSAIEPSAIARIVIGVVVVVVEIWCTDDDAVAAPMVVSSTVAAPVVGTYDGPAPTP